MGDSDRLVKLLRGGHRCVFISTHEEMAALDLVRQAAMSGGNDLLVWSACSGLRDGTLAQAETVAVAGTDNPAGAAYYLTQLTSPKIVVFLDLVDHLGEARAVRALREGLASLEKSGSHVVLIDHAANLPPVVGSYAAKFEMKLPGDEELEATVRTVARELAGKRKMKIELTRKDLDAIIRNLHGLSLRQARQVLYDVAADDTLDAADVNHVLAEKRRLLQDIGALEYIESPVSLDEIGGLKSLKKWLDSRQGAMSKEAREAGIDAPRGVMMLGVQGAGKSLSAKAVATAWQRPLLRLDAGALYDKFIGESERRLRDALRQAEAMAPVILWIDEIEKAFASVGGAGSVDGGLSKRMFGTLLTWMQEHRRPVFLIATANDISALPPELMRKGRFDEIFFVDLPDGTARAQIFGIHLKKRGKDPSQFDLARLATTAEGFSGAEIEQAVSAANLKAWHENGLLTTEMLESVVGQSVPLSVTMAEKMQELRSWARGRCVPAD